MAPSRQTRQRCCSQVLAALMRRVCCVISSFRASLICSILGNFKSLDDGTSPPWQESAARRTTRALPPPTLPLLHGGLYAAPLTILRSSGLASGGSGLTGTVPAAVDDQGLALTQQMAMTQVYMQGVWLGLALVGLSSMLSTLQLLALYRGSAPMPP